MIKSYQYINGLGRLKQIDIKEEINEKGEYSITLWDIATGEFCGYGEFTLEKLLDFLTHYGIIKDCD